MFKITFKCKRAGRHNRGLMAHEFKGSTSHATVQAFASDNDYVVCGVERVG